MALCAALIAACDKKAESGSSGGSGSSSGDKAAAPTTLARDTGIPECDAYLKAMDKFVTCKTMPPEQRDAYFKNTLSIYGDINGKKMSDDKKKSTAADCTKALQELAEGAKFRNCPIE
jgi:hypothetical protein